VGPTGRLGIELGALVLLAPWAVLAARGALPLPGARIVWPLLALVALAVAQALPLGAGAVALVSPRAVEIRAASRPAADIQAAEARLLGADPEHLGGRPTLSMDPEATASAARAGAALVAVLVVAASVTAARGAAGIALALLGSAAFQGLYGLLVLASGSARIWNVPKRYFLDCATGTYVNRNHYACLLAMSLPVATALICRSVDRLPAVAPGAGALVRWLRPAPARTLALVLCAAVALAGLLVSFSRAGIALGLGASAATLLVAGRRTWSARARVALAAILFALAVGPLLRLGAERLAVRYASSVEDLVHTRGRVVADSLELFAAFPVAGCGFGTYAAAYPLVRAPEVRQFYAHAHNDPLEFLAEGGLLGAALLALAALPLSRLLWRALAGAKGTLGVGCAAGVLAIALHGLVDFNFHVPANAVTASVLTGAMLGLPWKRRTSG